MARTIEKLTYVNERGESLEFSTASIYHCNEVHGLSDVRNAIYSINSMGQDGDTYLGNRIESRAIEIVGSIRERNKDFMHDHRRRMNHVLNPEYTAKLVYEYGDFVREIDCTIDNAPIFSRKAIFQDFTLQLLCLNPFWRKPGETRSDIATWIGLFEFPEEIPLAMGWEVGMREPSLIVDVYNEGDVKSGIRVEFKATGIITNPLLLNVNTGEFIKVNLAMRAGDVLTVNTGYGEKEVTLMRGGVTSDAFRYLDPDSTYMQLAPGDNLFRYDADKNPENLEVTIYHDDLYLGV